MGAGAGQGIEDRRSGRAYDQNGPYSPTPDGIRKALQHMYDPVWHHDVDNDIRDVVETLREKGTFPSEK